MSQQSSLTQSAHSVRQVLTAYITNQQLQDIFKIGRDQADGHQLIERVSEQHPRVLYIWFVTIVAGFGAVIGAVKAVPFVRRQLRTLSVPVQMKDQS